MLSLLAETAPDLPSLGVWVQLASTGGFGALVWYLIVKHLPKMQEDFTRALAAEREARTLELRAEREAHAVERSDYMSRMSEQEKHCIEERKESWAEIARFRQPLSDIAREIRDLKERKGGNTP